MILVTLLFALILVETVKSLHRYFTKTVNYWSERGINGPTALPIFGNFLDNLFTPLNVLEENRLLKYGSVYGYFEFSQRVLAVGDPKLIREVAIKQFHNFTNRYNRNPGDEFQKKGIFFMTDGAWKSARTLISPVFTSSKIKKMFPLVEQCCDNSLKYIECVAVEGKEIVLKNIAVTFTLDTIAKCIFGVNTNGYNDPNNEFLKNASDLVHLKLWRIFLSLLTPAKLRYPLNLQIHGKSTMDYFKTILQNLIDERKRQNVNRDDFINLLLNHEKIEVIDVTNDYFVNQEDEDLESNKNECRTSTTKNTLTNDEIISSSIMLLLAGYDTTATLLNFTLYSLAMNPDIQQKLFEEIEQYFSQNSTLDYDSINSLKYLDAVICEALRLYTPAVAPDRVAKSDCILGDIQIEKGTVISFPIYAMNRNNEYFADPYKFKPERFMQENRHLIKQYTYLPFGIGPRNCIGMRFALMTTKLFLAKFMKHFEVRRTRNTPTNLKYSSSLFTLSAQPLFAKFSKRPF